MWRLCRAVLCCQAVVEEESCCVETGLGAAVSPAREGPKEGWALCTETGVT